MSSHYYNYSRLGAIDGNVKPENLHLCIETDSGDYLYVVDSADNKIMKKIKTSDRTVSTIETRSKNIARIWHDRANGLLYCVDCEYDNTTSYIWKLDMSDDSVMEIESFPADVFDIFLYSNEVYIIYIGDGYSLEEITIDPNGDGGTLQWFIYPPPGNHFQRIDEGIPPNETDYIYQNSGGYESETAEDDFTFPNIDLSAYDSGEIYEVVIKTYGGKISQCTAYYQTKTNIAGLTDWKTHVGTRWQWFEGVYSGLSLVDSDLDPLEVTVKYVSPPTYPGINGAYVSTLCVQVKFYGDVSNAVVYIKNLTTGTSWGNDMGASAGRSWDISMISIVGTDFYFNFHWSNENVKLYKFATGTTTFSMVKEIT